MGVPGGFLDGNETAAAEDAFVDEAMAAFTQQFGLGEVVGGQLEIFVVEFLEFDDGFLFLVMGFLGGRR